MSTRVARPLVRALRSAAVAVALGAGGGAADRGARAQPATAPDSAAPRAGIARLGAVVRQRLQLTDEQTARLRGTAQRYAEQRRALLRDEREARRTVRGEVARGPAADQARVQLALDRLYQVQQRRTELAATEQRELATFLTPTQRAQYAGLQERAFRAAQDLRLRREAGLAGPSSAAPRGDVGQRAERRAERQARRGAAIGPPPR